MSASAVIDPERLESVVENVAGHAAAAAGFAMFELGDRLGLYRTLAGAGPSTASELAERTGCEERLVTEWLFSQAAAGYLRHHESTETFELGLEESVVLAADDSPAFFGGLAQIIRSFFLDGDRLAAAFKGGGGLAWDQHHECLYSCWIAPSRTTRPEWFVPQEPPESRDPCITSEVPQPPITSPSNPKRLSRSFRWIQSRARGAASIVHSTSPVSWRRDDEERQM